jgi:glycosyltransferase involved in cell wall biosynthesis
MRSDRRTVGEERDRFISPSTDRDLGDLLATRSGAAHTGERGLADRRRSAAKPQPTALIYRNALLPVSETFIKEQMIAYRRWRGVLIGRRNLHNLSLEGLDVRLLLPVRSYFLSRAWWRMSRNFDAAPAPVIAMLRREAPSLLHVHFGVDALDAWPLARVLNVPMLVTLHGYDINIERQWWEAGHWGKQFRRYPQRLLELAARPRVHFVAVSEAMRRRAIDFGIAPEKISVRYIGVDISRFTPQGRPIVERERRVLFVGRLVEKKGCEYLIRAMAKVQAAVPDALLVIAGDGDLNNPLQRLTQQLQVRAEFRGALSSAKVQQELALARALCLPSVTAANGDAEGFGMVLLEAQASGVPVVTSAKGGSDEGVCDGVSGLTFIERDIDTLVLHLITILTNDNIAKSMSLAGPQFVARKFDLSKCTQALEMLYDDMAEGQVANHRPPPGWSSRPLGKLPALRE